MDNIQITHIDGEPPIYTEMKNVSVSLESCIVNSEEDYQFDETQQSHVSDNYNDGNLSVEDINKMIMLNEGTNISSEKDELRPKNVTTRHQSGTSFKKTSDIKKILTNDLPAKGRFLSTKSLQKLSDAQKSGMRKRQFPEEIDNENLDQKGKQKKERAEISKTIKKDKINTKGKLKRIKLLEKKPKLLEHDSVDHENFRVKRLTVLKKDNIIEKKPLSKISKVIAKKKKDKDISGLKNPVPKILKKKILEGARTKKKISLNNEDTSKDIVKNNVTKIILKEEDTKLKIPKSRSRRIRKIGVSSEEFTVSPKEAKNTGSTAVQEKPDKTINDNSMEAKITKNDIPVIETDTQKPEKTEKLEDKTRAVNTALLQDVLSESVECWFDISPETEKKGKRTKRKFKIIPQATASDTEFPEETVNPLNTELNNLSGLEKTKENENLNSIQIENDKNGEMKNDLENTVATIKETCESNKTKTDHYDDKETNLKNEDKYTEKNEDNEDKKEVEEAKTPKLMPRKKGRLKGVQKSTQNISSPKLSNVKRLKPLSRQITSFSKKRRRVRNLIMMKGLKNYGEKIDFNQKIDPETEKEIIKDETTSSTLNDGAEGNSDISSSQTPTKLEVNVADSKSKEVKVIGSNVPMSNVVHHPEDVLQGKKIADKRKRNTEIESKDRNESSSEKSISSSSLLKSTNIIIKECSVAIKNLDLSFIKEKTEKHLIKLDCVVEKKTSDNLGPEKKPTIKKSEETKDKMPNNIAEKKEEKLIDEGKGDQNEEKKTIKGKQNKNTEDNINVEMLDSKMLNRLSDEKIVKEYENSIEDEKLKDIKIIENETDLPILTAENIKESLNVEEKINVKIQDAPVEQPPNVPNSLAKEHGAVLQKNDFSLGSMSKCIPFKKRGMRTKKKRGRPKEIKRSTTQLIKEAKQSGENIPPEGANPEINQTEPKGPPDRRKSYREIRLTPKLVDMIATSSKRPKKLSSFDNRSNCLVGSLVNGKSEAVLSEKDTGYANLIKRATFSPVKIKSEPEVPDPPQTNNAIENYLQTKMEQNAINFESSWVPGDLVWARFAGNPFWPSLILRDPFKNDEYSRVKYLGRLPRLFLHVQFLADWGRRAWGPEIYVMNFNGIQHYEKLKSNLPELGSHASRRDLLYQQAFAVPKKLESGWKQAIKEAETLMCKTRDERITYMKIKYPLVKYAASIANGHLVPNVKGSESKPSNATRKKDKINNYASGDQWEKSNENCGGAKMFECVDTSKDEIHKMHEKSSPKLKLKIVRSPRRGKKRKYVRSEEDGKGDGKYLKRVKRELFDDDYAPSDSGSNGDKSSEMSIFRQKRTQLFRGARAERVCQICLEIMEGEKIMKCKGVCQGLFHLSCANKQHAELTASANIKLKSKRRGRPKKGQIDEENIQNMEDVNEKDWKCSDCIRGENPCFVCKSRSGNRQKCCAGGCGKFYHQKCLKLYPQTIFNQGAPIKKYNTQQNKVLTESEAPIQQILSCPLHVCHTCASDNPSEANMKYMYEKLVRCVECPSAYHLGNYCVPAGSRILNTSQIICGKHCDADAKKSHVNISWCFICNMGGSLICCDWCPSSFHLDCLNIEQPEDSYICEECESGRFPLHGEVVWVKLGRYRWWPAKVLFPQEIPPNIKALSHKPWEFAVRFYGSNDHYWLSRGRVFLYQEGDSEQNFKGQRQVDKVYQKAVQEASRDYFLFQEERKQRREGSVTSVLKPPTYVKIKINKPIGKVQLGNTSQKEPPTCDCDPNIEWPCSPWSDCLNRMLMIECDPNYCNAGTRCKNQCFEKREYPPLEPYWTDTRGWGLKSSADIQKGQFVIEYVGEVVDEEEFKRRMKRKHEAKDNNYYFLTIDKDRIIDAGPKGNLARFMNHSCSPNCETQKWTVNGDTRVGLFALTDIPAGTELTFNYNLDCAGNEKKICKCEGINCSGFIGVKAKNSFDKSEGKSRNLKRWELKTSEDECFVCQDGGELMVCDVKNCPKVYHLECVGLTEWPNEKWLCPRHKCSTCNKSTKRCCKVCPNAFCFTHLDTNLFLDINGDLFCSDHINVAIRSTQQIRKPSYINRNTPVIEYEKPFAEKYRPPPMKERLSSNNAVENEILMEPNLTDNTPILVENPLLSSKVDEPPNAVSASRLNDGVSVKVIYVDEEGRIVNMDNNASTADDSGAEGSVKKLGLRKKKRTNIPRKKIYPHLGKDQDNKMKSPSSASGINFESIMIKSVEEKILDSKLNIDNICNIIGGGVGSSGGSNNNNSLGASEKDSDATPETQSETGNSEKCRDEMKPENKKDDAEVDRSRRSKYFKIITPEKFIKNSENEPNPKTVTDFNYIEFMHPLKSSRNKTKTDENSRK